MGKASRLKKALCLELLGKAHRLFIDRKEVTGDLKLSVEALDELSRLADAQD